MAKIRLEKMEFYAFHGCFEEEQAIGTYFNVDLELETDTTKSQQSDNLNDTVNYLHVYQVVKKEMNISSKLLENVCERIANAVLKEYNQIQSLSVKVSKLNPPLGGKLDAVSVEITKIQNTL
ncbi:MAG: dihydroneopterin aldolase [Bacteroidales bacterium]|jgi:dihydroneopterin aldolase|nr:dihydroneopterin aldolase [Bacteroidales bacterium]